MNSIWSRINIIASFILYPRHSSNRGELSERPTTCCCTARRSVPWMAMDNPYPKGIWRRWPRWKEGANGETKSQSTGNQGSELYADAVMTVIGFDVNCSFYCNEARFSLFISWLLFLRRTNGTYSNRAIYVFETPPSGPQFSFHLRRDMYELWKWRWYMPVYYRTERPTNKTNE